jgi:hypothetical protein
MCYGTANSHHDTDPGGDRQDELHCVIGRRGPMAIRQVPCPEEGKAQHDESQEDDWPGGVLHEICLVVREVGWLSEPTHPNCFRSLETIQEDNKTVGSQSQRTTSLCGEGLAESLN